MNTSGYRIVVGIDGSAASRAALDWAIQHARTRTDTDLALVHAWFATGTSGMLHIDDLDARRAAGQRILRDAERRARSSGETAVTVHLEHGAAATAIIDHARDADLIVVGSRSRGALGGLLLGSVSQAVVTRAAAPVAVINRTGAAEGGPIVVGVDDSTEARAALRWAAEHARRHAAPLKVVHAFQPHHLAGLLGIAKLQPDNAWRTEAARALAELVRAELGQLDGIALETVATQAGPAAGLLGAAAGASLVVLGTRGRGGAASVLLGSVSAEVLKKSRSPVVVIPPAHATPLPMATMTAEVTT